ncbi:hypothetical protein ENKNEFLB_00676 [Nocardioides aquaticus]|uniref:DUF4190 domain-containing protein n=1 Tax=Nocardioides aquaticus TaxID=160826 RepID=A0ABX8EI01_9ACTN|nr:DUF4190 domain-containing protein [Nocardioides aquaticus]QVT78303.1 hypothetical protein ENKNEFLB_00676 [Nocardioides aquaticus]
MTQPPPESPYGNNPNQPGQPNPYGSQPDQYGNQPNQYGNQPPQYGNQQYGGQPQSQKKGLAITALVLGILGLLGSIFVVGGLLSIFAIILGVVALIQSRKPTHGGKGLAISGIVLGVIGLVIAGAILAFVGSIFGDIAQCVDDAGGDQAAIDQCEREFNEQYTN